MSTTRSAARSGCTTTLAAKQAADPAAFADVTLGDLLASARAPAPAGLGQLYTLQELLPGIAPAEEFAPEEAAALDALLHRSTTNGNRLALGASFVVFCSETTPPPGGGEGLTIAIDAPGVGFTPGSATFATSETGASCSTSSTPSSTVTRLTFTRIRDGGGAEQPLSELCNSPGPIFASMSFDAEAPTRLGTGSITSTVTTGSGLQDTSQTQHYDGRRQQRSARRREHDRRPRARHGSTRATSRAPATSTRTASTRRRRARS